MMPLKECYYLNSIYLFLVCRLILKLQSLWQILLNIQIYLTIGRLH
jgi:hypothetical protein